MAKVWLSMMECMSGNLPPCCIVCGGEDEIEYLEREMEYRPSWPLSFLGFHFVGMHLFGAMLSWFSERYNQVIQTQFPYCIDHYDYWHKRDRRQHLGILIIALGWMIPLLITVIKHHNGRLSSGSIWAGAIATVVGLVVIYSYGFTMVHIANMKKSHLLMADVDADFVDAVENMPEP